MNMQTILPNKFYQATIQSETIGHGFPPVTTMLANIILPQPELGSLSPFAKFVSQSAWKGDSYVL
jgi:hypothetical protein